MPFVSSVSAMGRPFPEIDMPSVSSVSDRGRGFLKFMPARQVGGYAIFATLPALDRTVSHAQKISPLEDFVNGFNQAKPESRRPETRAIANSDGFLWLV